MQERTHAFAMKSQMWLLDPRPDLPTIVKLVEQGFELSEASHTPVMLMMRIRACHMHGRFVAQRQPAAGFHGARRARESAAHLRPNHPAAVDVRAGAQKVNERWPAAVEYIRAHALNEIFADRRTARRRHHRAGRALQYAACARSSGSASPTSIGATQVPIYVLNVTYPLLPAGGASVRRGQARRARGRGRPARVPRAGHRLDAGGRRQSDARHRQGPAADGGRVHGAVMSAGRQAFLDRARWRTSLPTAVAGRQDRSSSTAAAGERAGGQRARAAFGPVHGLSRATAVRAR